MISASAICLSLFLVFIVTSKGQVVDSAVLEKLEKAAGVAASTIASIRAEWQIDSLPYFLKSCSMHKLSWELMKLKFQKKILAAISSTPTSSKTKFVISFTGSSVTAGHDSHFNASTPVQTGLIMQPAFEALGIELDSRNVALGNNPCTPYDACVKFFVGEDADIVHWEQTYFCADRRPVIEQFIRQALVMKSQPIVVFSDSHSGKWGADICKTKPSSHTLTADEEALLKADTVHLVSEINKGELQARWGWLTEHMHNYHSAGIQTGAASWHPSVVAHRMRASHHAYFWLANFAEAIADIKAQLSHRVLDAVTKDVEHRLSKLHAPLGPAHAASIFPDNAKCYTDYEPRFVREASLKDHVISGLASESKPEGWTHMIYEDIVDKNLVQRSLKMQYRDFKYLIHGNKDSGALNIALDLSKDSPIFLCETPGICEASLKDHVISGLTSESKPTGWTHMIYEDIVDVKLVQMSLTRGYHDFKYLIHGNKNSGPLNIKLDISKDSPVIICETPGIWGSLPKGYDHLWSGTVNVYITYNISPEAHTSFTFDQSKAQKLDLKYEKHNDLCVTASAPTAPLIPSGHHVLTIEGTSDTQAIIAWIITA
eukprot:CAMPEP_0170431214 /NCGR_PEP_ID=MMETSP0117_2-20130122/41279_1 /TAXON_ID=400756 /ORGANISM="Durinskia baltica, Strain CSIRO CS-38" /LENGTH=599 /DNA_ID=CAMNT_0010690749 /DNA_START=31 /DNA_END=1830 /DNA_ORIENTATION=-